MVMKKTQNKHLFRTIRKNAVSFFAVAFIAATSIAIFLGIQEAATSILNGAERNFKEQKLATWEITCRNGITKEDMAAVAAWENVDIAEGGYKAMVFMDGETEKIMVHAISLCETLNLPVVLEGTLPLTENEVAIEQIFAEGQDLKVGDTLKLLHDGSLREEEFQITAIINTPSYNCAYVQDSRGRGEAGFGSAEYYIGLPVMAFNTEYYSNCYSVAYLLNEELNQIDFYDSAYETLEKELLEELEPLGTERAQTRYENLKEGAEQLIAAGFADAAVLEEIEGKEWLFSGRNDIGDVRGVKMVVDELFKLSYSLALIFLIVAIVVCYAAITRMMNEQKNLIGAQKAQGFSSGSILLHYMKYNALCATLGILLGWGASVVIVETLILYVFGDDFVMNGYRYTFVWPQALLVALLFLIIFLSATYVACRKLVRLPAIDLLRGEVPGQSKEYFFEKWKVYKKLKLYSRLMIKNVLNDKERMLTTIMGVVGCISLLIICFTLKLSIVNAPVKQFEDYFLYQSRLAVDSSKNSPEMFEELLDEQEISYFRIQDKLKNFRTSDGSWENVHIVTTDDFEGLQEFMVVENAKTGKMCEIPKDGVLISERCAEAFGLKEGSVVELMDSGGNAKECTVTGIISHFLPYHLFVMTSSYYEMVLGERAEECIFLLKGDADGLREALSGVDGYLSLKDNSEFMAEAESINLVIAICLTLSAVMALLVLLNQVTMHINKKARELSVMRINGYTMKETKAFVYKDNIVLTVMGLLVGSGFGMALAYLEVRIIETGANRYVRTPSLLACLLACGVGALFALIVNIIGLRKIKQLNLTNVSSN